MKYLKRRCRSTIWDELAEYFLYSSFFDWFYVKMSPKLIVTGVPAFGLREGKLLNPLDLIWFVPAWEVEELFLLLSCWAIICFFLTVTGFIHLNPVFVLVMGLILSFQTKRGKDK